MIFSKYTLDADVQALMASVYWGGAGQVVPPAMGGRPKLSFQTEALTPILISLVRQLWR
tara:strand:- start:30 stop:206 length:177 start_codon:yes stop_codon:yes gene_type:complete